MLLPDENVEVTTTHQMNFHILNWEIEEMALLERLFSGNAAQITTALFANTVVTGQAQPIEVDYFEMRIQFENEERTKHIPTCGDGVIHRHLSEECDDANQVDGDGCSSLCNSE